MSFWYILIERWLKNARRLKISKQPFLTKLMMKSSLMTWSAGSIGRRQLRIVSSGLASAIAKQGKLGMFTNLNGNPLETSWTTGILQRSQRIGISRFLDFADLFQLFNCFFGFFHLFWKSSWFFLSILRHLLLWCLGLPAPWSEEGFQPDVGWHRVTSLEQ